MPLSKSPAYNLKAVLKETNIMADTLRAWERRYGLPMPQRTEGGHRLYSQYDVETIKWLIARQAEGFSISRAVDLWNEQTASGVDPLAGLSPLRGSAALAAPAIYLPPNTSLESLRANWVAACMSLSEADSEQALNQAFSMFPVEAVCVEILQKGMVEIGELWYENNASVQQEHFASGLAMRRLDSLLSASPAPSRKQNILIGCPPNEWHTFTPLLLALLLRRRGFSVIYLGANVPVERFEETVAMARADLVILVAQTLISAAALQLTARELERMKIPVGFGGRIFNMRPDLKEQIPGDYLGNTIDASLDEVENTLKHKSENKTHKTASQEYVTAHRVFISKRAQIEAAIKELIQPIPVSTEDLNTGIKFLGDNIIAALQFGDMEYVTREMEWLKVMLQSHQKPPEELAYFMESYSQAVDKHIDDSGKPIKVWLRAQVNR